MPDGKTRMALPTRVDLPFFAYGVFRPGELAFLRLVDDCVSVQTSSIRGELRVRDGLALLDPNGPGLVEGDLLHFRHDRQAEAYQILCDLEPEKQYTWQEVDCGGIRANSLVGRRLNRGTLPREEAAWTNGREDPLFVEALDVIEGTLTSVTGDDLRELFRLEMAYLLLWSAIERYASLRCHLGERATQKVVAIGKEQGFKTALGAFLGEYPKRVIYSAADPNTKYVLSALKPEEAIEYYYQVRSNIVHRGKAATQDFERLQAALKELLPIFRGTLASAFAESEEAGLRLRRPPVRIENVQDLIEPAETDDLKQDANEAEPKVRRYLGIDFSGDQLQWEPGRVSSNIWVAEIEIEGTRLSLAKLYRVQDLPGAVRPFERLVQRLGRVDYRVAAIDAPFSIPASRMALAGKVIDHSALLNAIDDLELDGRDFPEGKEIVSRFAPEAAPSGVKDMRITETGWGVNTRSTLWNGPRGGSPMTAACLKVLAKAGRPLWPWHEDGPGLVAEAFPAAQLCHWGIAHDSYGKADEASQVNRARILEGLRTGLSQRDLALAVSTRQRQLLTENADALDALVCSLAALSIDGRKTARATERLDSPESRAEGWIAVFN